MPSIKNKKPITCPRCGGTGNENGCIGEGLCLLCFGDKIIDKKIYEKMLLDKTNRVYS